MKPFSAWYYVRENRKRSLLLILMIFLSFGVYVGGLYVTNPYDNWNNHIDAYKKQVSVGLNSDNEEEYRKFLDKIKEDNKVTIIELGYAGGMLWKTIMGFESGQCTYTFQTVSDFKKYCGIMDIECDYTDLKSGSMIMSDMFAKNVGMSIGDKVNNDTNGNIYGNYTLDKITKEAGYTLYFIEDEVQASGDALLIGNGIEGDELYDYVYSVQKEMDNPRDVYVYGGVEQDIAGQFAIFDLIYLFIAILFSIILAVTINAAFVGMYQRREYEFSVYRAIGISKKRIVGKIAGELLLIDAIALTVGTAATLLGLYLLNNLVLYPVGKYLRYFDGTALFYMILCNAVVIVPLIVTRCRQMLKTDICEY